MNPFAEISNLVDNFQGTLAGILDSIPPNVALGAWGVITVLALIFGEPADD